MPEGSLSLRRRARYAWMALLTMALGIVIRFGSLGTPLLIRKYGGSALWAALIYWLIRLLPRMQLTLSALIAFACSAAIETGKLYRAPWLDSFRQTLPGILILGRVFSFWDLGAYAIGICAAVVLDHFCYTRLLSKTDS